MIEEIRRQYSQERVARIDADFLGFEEEMAAEEDLKRIQELLCLNQTHTVKLPNPHNSCLLYATGLSDEFDFKEGRSHTIDGSPPDIDVDWSSLERQKIIQWVVEHWGREQVVNIGTQGTFKPKSITKDWFRVTEGDEPLMRDILSKIPPPQHGFEPTIKEVVEGNKKKNYPAHPELENQERYAGWLNAAHKLEGMVKTTGIHAAGLVIANEPVYETLPIWAREESELMENGTKRKISKWVTQFDMKETETLGLLKFDFLAIDNLSVMKLCCKLIKEHHGIDIDPYELEDGDPKAYGLIKQGLLTGLFQMETSQTAKDLLAAISPECIAEIADTSALNRPGPIDAGLHLRYIDNKNAGYDQSETPEAIADIFKGTYWTMVYQEQVMEVAQRLAGYTLKEADNIRRILGKKKPEEMKRLEPTFKERLRAHSTLTNAEIDRLWDEMEGFAAYALTPVEANC